MNIDKLGIPISAGSICLKFYVDGTGEVVMKEKVELKRKVKLSIVT